MKKSYPSYKKDGIKEVEKHLVEKDRITLEKFLKHCSQTANDYKVKCRKYEILQVYDIIGKSFDDWNLEDLTEYLSLLKSADRKPWTKKGILITLQLFIKWHFNDWSSKFNNLESLKKLSRQQKPNNSDRYNKDTMLSAEEIDKMIRSAKSIRDKVYISLAAEAGLPPKVQVNLKFKDCAIDSPEEGITTLKYFRTKNNESYVFPLGKISTYYLKQWKQEYRFEDVRKEDYLFPNPGDRTKPMTEQSGWYILKTTAKLAGINKPVYQYLIRHKALSDAYEKLPEVIHRKLFGHVKGSKMTGTYSHTTEEKALTEALKVLHKVDNISKEQRNKYEVNISKLQKELENLKTQMKRIDETLKSNLSFSLDDIKSMGIAEEIIKEYEDKGLIKRRIRSKNKTIKVYHAGKNRKPSENQTIKIYHKNLSID